MTPVVDPLKLSITKDLHADHFFRKQAHATNTAPRARVAIALDSEYVYDGLTERIPCWERDSWRTRVGPVAHADLWIQLLACMRLHQTLVRFFWLPSHIGIDSNEGADALAEQACLRHPYNELRQAKRHRLDGNLPRQSTDLPQMVIGCIARRGGTRMTGPPCCRKKGTRVVEMSP